MKNDDAVVGQQVLDDRASMVFTSATMVSPAPGRQSPECVSGITVSATPDAEKL
jgi:hypothetical protein